MAKIIVEGPDGKKYAFPDDMPRAEINAFMKQKYGTKAPTETVNDYLARVVREQDATAARKAAKDKEATAAGRAEGARAAERMGIDSPLMMAAGANAIGLAERAGAGTVYEKEGTILPDEAAGLSALNSLGMFIPSMVNQEFGNRLNKARTQNPEAALVGDVAGGFLPGEVIGGVVSKAAQAIGPSVAQLGKLFKGGDVAEALPAMTTRADDVVMANGLFGGGKKPPPAPPPAAPERPWRGERYETLRMVTKRENPGLSDQEIDAITAEDFRAFYGRPAPGVKATEKDFAEAWDQAVREAKDVLDSTAGPGNYSAADVERDAIEGYSRLYAGGRGLPEDTMALPLTMAKDGDLTRPGKRLWVFEVNGKAFTGATPEEASRRAGDLSPAMGNVSENQPKVRKYAIEEDGTEIPYEEAIRSKPKASGGSPDIDFARLVAAEQRLNVRADQLDEADLFRLAEPYARSYAAKGGQGASEIERAASQVYARMGGTIKPQGMGSRALDAAETAFGGMVGAGTGAVTGQQYDLNGDGVINETDQGIGSIGGALAYTVGGRALQGATQLGRLFRGEQAGQTLASPAAMGAGALKSAAIKVKGKVYTGKDHFEAVQAAERDGLKIDSIADTAGFVDANGKFLPRDSEEAIYGALAAGQIKDPARLRVIENALKEGKRVTLTSDMLDFGAAASRTKPNGLPGTPQQAAKFETPGSPEWEAAKAKGLDMSQAGRMARAKEMGFDTETALYHGTPADVSEFKVGDTGAIYMASDPESANRFARFHYNDTGAPYQDGANVMPLYVRGRLKDVPQADSGQWRQVSEKLRKETQAAGFDGARVQYPDGSVVTVVFDPSNIRSVNAAFDPDKAASPILTAGVGGQRKPKQPKAKD